MPTIRDIPLALDIKDVLRWQGFREHSRIKPGIKNLVLELLDDVKNSYLIQPSAAYEIHPVTGTGRRLLSPTGRVTAAGLPLPASLAKAEAAAAAVCTIGPGLEKQSAECFSRNEPLRGALLDGIGNAAVMSLAHEVCKLVTCEALSRGYQAGSAFSPGTEGLPISVQRHLLKLARAENIGVSLTAAGLMVPCKSTSMIIGMGKQIPGRARSEVCTSCKLKNTCPYRMPVSTSRQDSGRV